MLSITILKHGVLELDILRALQNAMDLILPGKILTSSSRIQDQSRSSWNRRKCELVWVRACVLATTQDFSVVADAHRGARGQGTPTSLTSPEKAALERLFTENLNIS